MTDIPQEWVEAAARALHDDFMWHHAARSRAWGECAEPWRQQLRRQAEAALIVVAPLIAARERERAAKMVEGMGPQGSRSVVAAAIRARGKE